jgi:murein DD-endopeptidase MepM/ murein hydrolase activator NlpD
VASGGAAASDYQPPLPGELVVLRPFDPPATRYGPGHLGVDLRAAAGETVRAAGAGTVTFAGPVAGRGVVVIAHPDGVSTEYEPVWPRVRVGSVVRAGEPVAVLRGHHRGCPGVCLHWGARRAGDYFDPLRLLPPLGPVVLLPWAGD